jgi:hypothetical protein
MEDDADTLCGGVFVVPGKRSLGRDFSTKEGYGKYCKGEKEII